MSTSSRHATHLDHPLPAGARYIGPHSSRTPIEVTLVLRRKGNSPTPAAWPHAPAWRREDYGTHYGADPADVERLRSFAREQGLQETDCQTQRRTLRLSGSVTKLQRAFGVQLGRYQLTGHSKYFIGCTQTPKLPPELASSVIAILGLDRRPVAKPHYRKPLTQPSTTYTPIQLGQLYSFPENTDGTGQSIGIIELGGGFKKTDLTTYFKSLGLKTTPSVTAVSVNGGKNQPGGDADMEVMLDIEVIGALAPAAQIFVYFSPNTDQGFYEAISQAAHDTTNKPSIISISWGGSESSWSASSLAAMQTALEDAVALGVTVTVAAGDNGSSDGETDGQSHVDFPASSPYSLACGGTSLVANGTTIQSEVVWNETATNEGATGGGVSVDFALPSWQSKAAVPKASNGFVGRGVPDVAGDADPDTGYQVFVDGQAQVLGGTSAVAPLWAALLARCNQSLGRSLGDVHPALYSVSSQAFHDIVSGNNGSYTAGPGWDACTGLGSPNGQSLLQALTALDAPAHAPTSQPPTHAKRA